MSGGLNKDERFSPIGQPWKKVKVHYSKFDPPKVFETFDKWHIEGNFLIIFNEHGTKSAYRLPNGTEAITEEGL